MKKFLILMAALTMAVTTAVSTPSWAAERQGKFQLGGGVGLGFNDPIHFDLQIMGDYFFWEHVSVGMNIDFLIRDGVVFVFQPFGRYHFDIPSAPEWVPYVGGGLGVAVSDDGDAAMDIMVPNFGFKYELIDDDLFLGTDMSLHVITDFDNTTWDFRWLIVHAVWRF